MSTSFLGGFGSLEGDFTWLFFFFDTCCGWSFIIQSNLNFQELDLVAGIPVGTSLIDAHAGGVGVMESVPVAYSEPKGC